MPPHGTTDAINISGVDYTSHSPMPDSRTQRNAREHVAPMSQRLDAAIQRALDDKRIVGTVVLVAHKGDLRQSCRHRACREARAPMREDAIFLLDASLRTMRTANPNQPESMTVTVSRTSTRE